MKYHALIFNSNSKPNNRNSGGHRIATILRSEGWDVEVIDFATHWKLDQLKELLKMRVTKNTMFFGFSCFFNNWNNTLTDLTHYMKKLHPNIKIILGGSSINFAPAPKENIDYWVDGYGEKVILEIVKNITGNTSTRLLFDFQNFADKKVIKANIHYPSYPLDSYKILYEKRDFLKSYEWSTTEISRGCKFSCSFCNFPILGVKGDYSRTQEDFEEELKHNYDNFGIKNYYIADETFNDSTEKIIKFADVVEKLNFKPFFSGFVRADLMVTHKDSWEHLNRMGFGGHYYGVESFNHQSAKAIKKGMHPDKLKNGLLEIKNHFEKRMFYRGTISLIAGLPFETEQTLMDTQLWLEKNWSEQSATIWPLSIENSEFANNFTNVSEFSKNLLKYGIREMKNYDEVLDLKFKELEKYRFRGNDMYSENLNVLLRWEHDTMNIIEATLISSKMQKSKPFTVLTNFSLDKPSFITNTEVDLYATKYFDVDILYKDISTRRKFVNEYIHKKLSL